MEASCSILTEERAEEETDMTKRIVSIRKFATCITEVSVFDLKLLPYVGKGKDLPVKFYYKHRWFQDFVGSSFGMSLQI